MSISQAYQSTSTFSGNYKKASFAFERRWSKDGSVTESMPTEQTMNYIQPSIPPEAPPEVSPAADLQENNDQSGGGVSDTIRNLLQRFRRPANSYDGSNTIRVEECSSPVEEQSPPVEEIRNEPQFNDFAATDIYIKHCDLCKDGTSLNSLSQIDASRTSSPCSYYQFAKVLGAVQTGFSPGITMDDYEKAYPIFSFDLSNSGESYDSMLSTSARVGYYRLSTLFSDPTPSNITAIYFFEYSGTLTVDHENKIKRSFVV